MLAYGTSADSVDEYVRMGPSTSISSLKLFSVGVLECFQEEFLRPPNQSETKTLLQRGETLGFP